MARRKSSSIKTDIAKLAFLLLLVLIATTKMTGSEILYGIGTGIIYFGAFIFLIVIPLVVIKKSLPQSNKTTEHKPPYDWRTGIPSDYLIKSHDVAYDSKSAPKPEAIQPKLTLETLQEMDWRRFEYVCLEYFKARGYEAEFTQSGADGGVDITLKKPSENHTELVIYVQCKAWSKRVGVKPVRELYGVLAADKVRLGIFMTASDFTHDAMKFAEGKRLKLITGQKLLGLIGNLPEEKQEKITKAGMQGDYKTPSCPGCEAKMVLRTSKKGNSYGSQFWGCKNYPRCRQTFQVKAPKKAKPLFF